MGVGRSSNFATRLRNTDHTLIFYLVKLNFTFIGNWQGGL